MSNRLTDKKIEEMYACWLDTKSTTKVAVTCGVSENTVRYYRNKLKWSKQAEKVTKAVARRVEDEAVRRRARHIKQAWLLQQKGSQAITAKDPTLITTGDGIRAIETGIHLEREILGDSESEEITITIKMPKGLNIG